MSVFLTVLGGNKQKGSWGQQKDGIYLIVLKEFNSDGLMVALIKVAGCLPGNTAKICRAFADALNRIGFFLSWGQKKGFFRPLGLIGV